MVLFDDTLALARHRPAIEMAKGWGCVPYLFGVAIYCFGAAPPPGRHPALLHRICRVSLLSLPAAGSSSRSGAAAS